MNSNTCSQAVFFGLGFAVLAAGQATAQILVNTDITTSTTWTANNVYDLQAQVYVMPGATLTIQAGTVVASTTNGSLAVARGGQIFVQGTADKPVIMTSAADVATWSPLPSHPTGKDPKTGTWREACNEWGNLTIMGNGFISANNHGNGTSNTPVPSASNVAAMEGLTAQFPGDTRVLYGGGNDDDDSGSIHYLSIRYGGRVIGLNNELNGLSLGGIGRNTDIDHVEVMNNVDDAIEIWGGTVNLKYVSLWNPGDDGFDVDEGWRGKAQFGLIVMGYSVDAAQGSGVSDKSFEMDGAEDSDWQPVTTSAIYNFTTIGQPETRGTTAFRDNARVQFHNCIFMDNGSTQGVVRNDNVDGDGAHGYGFNGTLTWAQTWTTPYTATSTVNAPANPALFYTVQTSGNLIEFKDNVFFNNYAASAYTEANSRGVFNPANNNVQEPANSPITSITRGPSVVKGGKVVQPVIGLNPLPQNDALTSATWAPNDGFFSGARFRGAFKPGVSWLTGWTASEAFGFTPHSPWTDLGLGTAGTAAGEPDCAATGTLAVGTTANVTLDNAPANSLVFLDISFSRLDLTFFGIYIVPNPNTGALFGTFTNGSGAASMNIGPIPTGFSGSKLYCQWGALDASGPAGVTGSNAIVGIFP